MPSYTHSMAIVSWPQILWRHFTLSVTFSGGFACKNHARHIWQPITCHQHSAADRRTPANGIYSAYICSRWQHFDWHDDDRRIQPIMLGGAKPPISDRSAMRGPKPEAPKRPRARVGFLGRWQSARGLGERCKLPQRDPGQSPDR